MAGPPSASQWRPTLGHSQQEAMGRKEWVSSDLGVTLATVAGAGWLTVSH